MDCFIRKETTAKLHISLSTECEKGRGSDSLALSDRRKGKEGRKKMVPGLDRIATCWRKCKDRHAIWMQPTSMKP